jgi:microcystin-dependent protein
MSTPTTNFGWIKPTLFGNINTWGSPLNTNLDSQDSLIRRLMNTFWNTTAPSEKQNGTQWVDTTTSPYIWKMYDGTDWITIGNINPTDNTFTPSGSSGATVSDYKQSAVGSDHDGWLLCDGRSISTTTYSGLFAVIGYAFGGSGATFTLPDARGRVPGVIGTGTSLTPRALGDSVGEETHTLTIPEMPAHTHTHTQANSVNPGSPNFIPGTLGSGPTVSQLNSTGGGGAHNNMQPTLFIGNLFIYAGV